MPRLSVFMSSFDVFSLGLKPLVVVVSLFLAACASVPSQQESSLPVAQGSVVAAESAEAREDWQQAAAEWLALADVRTDAEAQYFRVRGLSALLSDEDVLRARVVFDSIDQTLLSPADQERAAVLQADLLLQEGRPGEALVVLPLVLAVDADVGLRARFLAVRATAFAEQGALISAIEDFTARNRLLLGAESDQAWQLKLWPLLVGSDELLLREGLRRTSSQDVAGWLRLALVGQQEWLAPTQFERSLDTWQAQNTLHAANALLLPALREAHALRQTYPDRIAVLLPLSGRYAAVGASVRDGLLAAWYAGGASEKGRFEFVDTEKTAPAEWLASQDELSGLAVIGPLRKEKIDELLAAELSPEMLWLPLNQASVTDSDYQVQALALSPEQEAEIVAERMSREGHRRALVIAAQGDWGYRVVEAFKKRFVETGGKVVGVERYPTGQSDYGDTIQRALLLDQSERRHARMTRTLARNIEFEPRRRSDVDAVFAPGQPRALRALRPQLKFYRASGLPVYATSHVWAGKENPAADLDLNGVRFPSMPWSLQPLQRDQRLKGEILKAGGTAKRDRFYALGADALRVLPILADRQTGFPWVFPGGTGQLEAGDEGLIQRRLVWAYFRKGKPVLLPNIVKPGA